MLNRELCSEVVPDMPHNGEILALDIGTRTIMGVVLEKSAGGGYRLRAAQQYEHLDRAMYQGQVHNVAAVAQGVYKVKTALERRRKTTFHRAAVAAAGRTLRMSTGQARHQRSSLSAVTAAEIKALELEALRVAQAQLAREEGEAAAAGFFCVGYSISQYLLDGQPISELLGQVKPGYRCGAYRHFFAAGGGKWFIRRAAARRFRAGQPNIGAHRRSRSLGSPRYAPT